SSRYVKVGCERSLSAARDQLFYLSASGFQETYDRFLEHPWYEATGLAWLRGDRCGTAVRRVLRRGALAPVSGWRWSAPPYRGRGAGAVSQAEPRSVHGTLRDRVLAWV